MQHRLSAKINDMDTISAADLARELDTSVPRVTRAAERLGVDGRQASGRFAFSSAAAQRLREALGSTPPAEGLSRSELIVLAALRSAPFGLGSARAVARRGALSPTTAAGALESLERKGLVVSSESMIAEGQARRVRVWRANVLHPRWPSLDPVLADVARPEGKHAVRRGMRVPARLRHLFWNTADSQLDVRHAGPYIARRLLREMDLQGLAWGAQALSPQDWERAARARGLDAKTRRLALNLAEAGLGDFAVTHRAEGTLKGVAGLQDLMAMKLKVMAERGEMRDYFDIKEIDERGAVSVEEGIELYMRRYGVDRHSEALAHLYRAMGDLSDVEVDEMLPIELGELQAWWSRRQARVIRNSDRFG